MSEGFDEIMSVLGDDFLESKTEESHSESNTTKAAQKKSNNNDDYDFSEFNSDQDSFEIQIKDTQPKQAVKSEYDDLLGSSFKTIEMTPTPVKNKTKDDYDFSEFNSGQDSFEIQTKNIPIQSIKSEYDDLLGSAFETVSTTHESPMSKANDDYDFANFSDKGLVFEQRSKASQPKKKEKSEYDDIFGDFYEVE